MANKTICALTYGDTHVFTLPYGECSTAASTAAKVVAVQDGKFSLEKGARVCVKFTVTNTASNPTLNVSSTGAKSIMYRGNAIPSNQLAANRVYEFIYDGTDWELIGSVDSNDWYGGGTSIPSGSDLDTYTTIGKYAATTEAIAQSLINCPIKTNFTMHVFTRTSGNSINQLIMGLNGKMYMRGANSSGVFRDWIEYTSKAEVEKMISEINNYNFVYNWNFQDPINSKGQTSYPGGQWTIDNWYATHNVNTVTINQWHYTTITNTQTSEYMWFRQYLKCGYLVHGTYTLSVLIEDCGDCSVYFCNDDGNAIGGNVYALQPGLNVFTQDINSLECSRLQFVIGYNTSLSLRGVKIERGSISILAVKDREGKYQLKTDGWDKNIESMKMDGGSCFEVGDLKESLKNESWLKCNGSFFSSQAYPDLYSVLAQSTKYEGPYSVISGYNNYYFYNNTHIFTSGNKIYYAPLTDISDIKLGGSMPSTISSISRVKFINNKYVTLCKGTDGRNYICVSNGITSAFSAYRIANDASDPKVMSLSDVAYFKGYYIIAVHIQYKTNTSYTCGYLYISASSLTNDATWTYKQNQSYTDSSSYSYGITNCVVNEANTYIYFTTWRSGGSTDYGYIKYGTAVDNAMASSYTLVFSYHTNDAALIKVGNYIYAIAGGKSESGSTQKQSAVYVTDLTPTTFTTITSFTSNVLG